MHSFPSERDPRKQSTILIVDDEMVLRDMCARVLGGYRILQAGNGREALAVLERESVDVVLADVMMPEMNGLDLLMAIKERSPNQLVIIMTGFADKDVILRALKADADDFINKPINLLQLKSAVDKVLEKQALREELVQLKRMDRLKSDFLGLISHKLKTPTTAISLFIQNLAEGIDNPRDPVFLQALEMVLAEANYLEYLIKDLLYYSEFILQEGPLRREPFQPEDLVFAVISELSVETRQRGVQIVREVAPGLTNVELDRRQMTFVLRALVENAVKFTPYGGTVTVRIAPEGVGVRFSVSDSGKGIPADELPKIFEKFYQVDPDHTGQVRGFGLGLYYARQFVQNHGGSIHFDSQPGQGTVATVLLPRG